MTAILAICVVAGGLLLEAGLVATKRAGLSAAADAAALAAADELALGHGTAAAMRRATEMAQLNGVRLVRCACAGREASVTVTITIEAVTHLVLSAQARAVVELSAA